MNKKQKIKFKDLSYIVKLYYLYNKAHKNFISNVKRNDK